LNKADNPSGIKFSLPYETNLLNCRSLKMKYLLLLNCFGLSVLSFAQVPVWTTTFSHSKTNEIGGISCDSNSNTYIAGRHRNGYHGGLFRRKYNPAGDLLWSDTTNFDSPIHYSTLAGDQSGNCYISATSNTNCIVGDSAISFGSAYGYNNSFLFKQDENGTIAWTKTFPKINILASLLCDDFLLRAGEADAPTNLNGEPLPSGGVYIKIDQDGNYINTVHTGPSTITFAGIDSAGFLYLEAGGWPHPYLLMKYDQQDSLLWSRSLPQEQVLGMMVDKAGNIVLNASGPRMGGFYTSMYNSEGDLLWTTASPPTCNHGNPMRGDDVTFYYDAAVDASSGRNDNVLIKKSLLDGSILDVVHFTTPDSLGLVNTKITKDTEDNIIVAGSLLLDVRKAFVVKIGNTTSTNIREENPSSAGSMALSPNPSQGVFRLEYLSKGKRVQLQVVDSHGRRVYFRNAEIVAGRLDTSIDLSGKAKGIYTVEVLDGKKRSVKKVIIE
jgi:hypothetical protein